MAVVYTLLAIRWIVSRTSRTLPCIIMLYRRSRKKFTSGYVSSTSGSLTGNPPLSVATDRQTLPVSITRIPETPFPQPQTTPLVSDRSPPPLPGRSPPLPDRSRKLVFPDPPTVSVGSDDHQLDVTPMKPPPPPLRNMLLLHRDHRACHSRRSQDALMPKQNSPVRVVAQGCPQLPPNSTTRPRTTLICLILRPLPDQTWIHHNTNPQL